MAGTDKTQQAIGGGPAIVLVGPQLGENIGAAARAMYNFGLTELRLVRPRDGWPNPAAVPMASGADFILDQAQLYRATEDAIADLHLIFATTARPRDMLKPVVVPHEAARAMRAAEARGERVGILFGPEKAGLDTEDVVLADTIITVPVNPRFGSLNLAQAVLLVGYEWFQAAASAPVAPEAPPATKADLQGLFDHLESELEARNFFRPPERRGAMVKNLRNLWQRAGLYEPDIRTLRGIVKTLTQPRR